MKKRIQDALARVASVAYQMKYIVHGTTQEYVLPDELLDFTCSLIETALSSSTLRESWTETERDQLSRLLGHLRKVEKEIPFNDERVSNYDLVARNPCWLEASKLAREYLEMTHFDLHGWEKHNV